MLLKGRLGEHRVSGLRPHLLQMGTEWVVRDVWVTLRSLCTSALSIQPEGLPNLILTSKKGPTLPPHYELKPYFLLWQNPNSWGRGALRADLRRSQHQTQALGQLTLAMSVPCCGSEQARASMPQEQGLT